MEPPAPGFTEILRSQYCHKWPVRVNDRASAKTKGTSAAKKELFIGELVKIHLRNM
jgi:hypothetical protein